MGIYPVPVCRQDRRAGEKVFLKGERCYTPKCAFGERRQTPGERVPRRRRMSDWGLQLREKQKARQSYGVLERQFRRYVSDARKPPGVTGDNPPTPPERTAGGGSDAQCHPFSGQAADRTGGARVLGEIAGRDRERVPAPAAPLGQVDVDRLHGVLVGAGQMLR